MDFKNFFIPILIFVSGLSQVVESAQLKMDVSAKSAILINSESGSVLYEKNAHDPLYPASITKIATALYALDKKEDDLDEMVTAVQDCLGTVPAYVKRTKGSIHPSYRLEPDGTNIGLHPGEKHSLRTLLYGMMLASGNDASNVIAHAVSGSVPQFIEEINNYFQQIGLKNTHFNNPHGLHHPEHYTTAYDMAMMTRIAMSKPFFREIVKTIQYPKPESNKQPASTFVQSNRLLRRGQYFYPKAIGVKTGYHSISGHTLVAAAENGERSLIVVVLNCPDASHRFKDAISLFETAFAEKKVVRTLFAKQYDTFNLLVHGGKIPLIAALAEDLQISYFPSEEPEFKAFLEWKALTPPIQAGDFAGEIQLTTTEGKILGKGNLYATSTVEPTTLFRLTQFFHRFTPKKLNATMLLSLLAIGSLTATAYYFKRKFKSKKAADKAE